MERGKRLAAHALGWSVILVPFAVSFAAVKCGWTAELPAWAELAVVVLAAYSSAALMRPVSVYTHRVLYPASAKALPYFEYGVAYTVASVSLYAAVLAQVLWDDLRLRPPSWAAAAFVGVSALVCVARLRVAERSPAAPVTGRPNAAPGAAADDGA